MPIATVPVPISTPVYRNVDNIELSDDNYEVIDGYLNDRGGTQKRPGLTWATELETFASRIKAIDGLYWWSHKSIAIAVSGGIVYKLTYDKSTETLTATSFANTDLLEEGTPVSFATDGDYLFMANGGRILYTDGTALPAYIADSDAPTEVTHVVVIDGYVIANEAGTNRFAWSKLPDDPLTWEASDYASAAGDADNITSMFAHNRELYLLGPDTTEIWENDGETPFIRIPGGFIATGIAAPQSAIPTEAGLFWLNTNRKFIEATSKGVQYISSPYDKEIQGYSSVSDCVGMRVEIAGKPFLIFTFPEQNKTLVYNYVLQDWSEWRYYVPASGYYERWIGQAHTFSPDWGIHLVGSRKSDSKIYFMSEEYYDDDGNEIRLQRTTGHIDYGTGSRKRSHQMRIRLKRGSGDLTSRTPQMMIRWKDDGKDWKKEHYIDLGDIGETEIIKRFHRSGMYRTRQYQFTVSDPVPVSFTLMEEDIEVLGR